MCRPVRNKVAVLMRRGREAVQQHELGVSGLASFAVKDVEPLDRKSSHPYRSLCGIGSIVHLTLLRRCPRSWWGYSAKCPAAEDAAQARPRTSCTSSPTLMSPPSITKQLSASLP